MTFEALQPLLNELDAHLSDGLTAELWWRDDNAVAPTVELDRLIALSNRHGVPCGLAANPADAGEPLRKAVSDAAHVWVLQHGVTHADRAPGGIEDGEPDIHRPKSEVFEELRQGMLKFNQLFKVRFIPVLAPPWGHLDPALLAYLPVMGFRGLSSVHHDQRSVPPGDLRVADVYCDVLDWSDPKNPRFAGTEACVAALVEHLRNKRTGKADATEPTGLRTHHRDMDQDAWTFMGVLLDLTVGHPATRWMSPAQIWPSPE